MQKNSSLKKKPNRLIHEKSPYLFQHAYNPVNWYPWGKEAFLVAKKENKPVFLSIGYSTCHWCHVMNRESFDNKDVAEVLNKSLVCIKVDKEERPDLNNVYMKVCQIMGHNCGWPLNIIMTPSKNPFFSSSYIPKENRFGMIGIMELIPQIEKIWETQKAELEKFGENLKIKVQGFEKGNSIIELGSEVLDDAFDKLFLFYDKENGGFGEAPKFPASHNLLFLLRYWKRSKNKDALMIVKKTLREIRLRGIFDQIGFGFHRYSTDKYWLVPHFEKMLYDQALLVMAYVEAYQITKERKFEITAKEILEYVLRELTSEQGGFYTAEDAESENTEGKFYLWKKNEIEKALPPELIDIAIATFNIERYGNYPEARQKQSNENILYIKKPLIELANEFKINSNDLIMRIGRIQKLLFNYRKKRIPPFKDKKILVDWNGLMIAAFAKASRILNVPEYLEVAIKAGEFIWEKMREKNRGLHHRFSDNEVGVNGFLDDYMFLIWGFLEIYEGCFKNRYLDRIEELFSVSKIKFWDDKNGGFYFSEKIDDEVPRFKNIYDGSIPSGNSVALLNSLRFGMLTENSEYENIASQILQYFAKDIKTSPISQTFLLCGLDFLVGPSSCVTLEGKFGEDNLNRMIDVLNSNYLPNVISKVIIRDLANSKDSRKAVAYICTDKSCKPPANDANVMLKMLDSQ